MGAMDSRVIRIRQLAPTLGRPALTGRNVARRDGSLRLPWGEPLSGSRAHRTRPTETPNGNPHEPGGDDAA